MTTSLGSRTARVRAMALSTAFAVFLSHPEQNGRCAEMLYWTAVDEGPLYSIRRSALDGSNVEDVVPGLEDSLGGLVVDADAGMIYWIEIGTTASRIVQAGLDGRGRKILHTTQDDLSRLALHAAEEGLYFTATGPLERAGIRRVGIAGGDVEDVIAREVHDLAVDGAGGKIYWVQEGGPGIYGTDIWSAALDGSDPRIIVHHTLEHHTTGIAIDPLGGKIYWATVDYRTTHAQIVQRANLDGSTIEDVTTANPGLDDWPVFMDFDLPKRMLYWVNGEDGVFYRVGLDGGEAQMLHEDSGPYGPFDLAVLTSEEGPPEFRRGDADGNGAIELTDPIATLGMLFLGAGDLRCADAADVTDDGVLDITDAVASLTYQFLGDFAIPAPGPLVCGGDPTPADALGCGGYDSCSS